MVYGVVAGRNRKIGPLAGAQGMICPTCHGNGYVRGVDGYIAQCETCDSQGEIEESKNAKTDED